MNLLGIDIPPLAAAVGSLIAAFIVGLGAGLGNQVGQYLFTKLWKHRLDKLAHHGRGFLRKLARNRRGFA